MVFGIEEVRGKILVPNSPTPSSKPHVGNMLHCSHGYFSPLQDYPEYYEVITEPIDLSIIKKNLEVHVHVYMCMICTCIHDLASTVHVHVGACNMSRRVVGIV